MVATKARSFAGMLALLILLFTLGAPNVFADLIFNIDTGNPAISGYTGPYAQVDVRWVDSKDAVITFTSLTKNGNVYLMGDGGSVAVNVNATSWAIGAINGLNGGSGFDPGDPYSDGGSGNENGWGSFDQTVNSFDGYTHSSDTISFGLTNTSGTWASASDVLTANNAGALAAAHIFVTSSPANGSNGALATGYAAGNSGGGTIIDVVTPEPASILLLGGVLLATGRLLRRRLRVR